MKRIFIVLILFVSIIITANGQQNKVVQALTVGDKVPDELFTALVKKSDGKKTPLSNLLNGRNLIIDFFATWCTPCIKALPEIQSLQQTFKDKLLILPVTREGTEVLSPFLATQPYLNGNLDFVSEDRVLLNYFPHRMVPHEVWINSKGIVVAITDGKELSKIGLENFISGSMTELTLKKDDLRLSLTEPLFINGNGGSDTAFTYRSVVGKYIPGGPASTKIVRDGNLVSKFTATNNTALNLFTTAFSNRKLYVYNWNYIVAEVRDSSRLTRRPKSLTQEWREKNMYSYQLSFKQPIPDTLFFRYMMQDLNRTLDLSCDVIQRPVLCNVISRKDFDDDLLRSKTNAISGPYTGKMRNLPFDRLVEHLCNYIDSRPFINETNINFNVDMDLDFSTDLRFPPDLEKIRITLSKYGLVLKQEYRTISVMHIKDKPGA